MRERLYFSVTFAQKPSYESREDSPTLPALPAAARFQPRNRRKTILGGFVR